jgi:antitoxin MazE
LKRILCGSDLNFSTLIFDYNYNIIIIGGMNMHAKIVAIGTSKGVRMPSYLIKKYHFENMVEMEDTGSGVLIRPLKRPREGWAEAFKKVAGSKNDNLLEMPESEWDRKEWEW